MAKCKQNCGIKPAICGDALRNLPHFAQLPTQWGTLAATCEAKIKEKRQTNPPRHQTADCHPGGLTCRFNAGGGRWVALWVVAVGNTMRLLPNRLLASSSTPSFSILLFCQSQCTNLLEGGASYASFEVFLVNMEICNTKHEFRYGHCIGQFTPKMKANAEPRLLSSLV